jgi:hypothetical protein
MHCYSGLRSNDRSRWTASRGIKLKVTNLVKGNLRLVMVVTAVRLTVVAIADIWNGECALSVSLIAGPESPVH